MNYWEVTMKLRGLGKRRRYQQRLHFRRLFHLEEDLGTVNREKNSDSGRGGADQSTSRRASMRSSAVTFPQSIILSHTLSLIDEEKFVEKGSEQGIEWRTKGRGRKVQRSKERGNEACDFISDLSSFLDLVTK